MTVTADGVLAGGSAARVSGRGPARAAVVEQLSRADRVARGKDARAVAPLESHAEFTPAPAFRGCYLISRPCHHGASPTSVMQRSVTPVTVRRPSRRLTGYRKTGRRPPAG